MNCHRVVNLMSAYIDGELTGEEMLAIRRHMATCSECAEEHDSLIFTKRAVSNLASARPRADFAAAILAQLEAVTVPKHQRLMDWFFQVLRDKVSPVAAALAVSGAALVMLASGEVDRLTPTNTANMMTPPVQQVSFVRGLPRDTGVLTTEPLQLVTDIPGMSDTGVRFASLTIQ